MNKKDYIRIYNDAVQREFEEIKDEFDSEESAWDMAYESVSENANVDEIVGYYLFIYGDNALETWTENVRDIQGTDRDKEVTHILSRLFC